MIRDYVVKRQGHNAHVISPKLGLWHSIHGAPGREPDVRRAAQVLRDAAKWRFFPMRDVLRRKIG
jgi:hypothetical protein